MYLLLKMDTKVLAGRVFSFKRLVSKITPNSNGAFNELIGYGKTIDILYRGLHVDLAMLIIK